MSWRTDALLGFNATLCLLQMESTSKKYYGKLQPRYMSILAQQV